MRTPAPPSSARGALLRYTGPVMDPLPPPEPEYTEGLCNERDCLQHGTVHAHAASGAERRDEGQASTEANGPQQREGDK